MKNPSKLRPAPGAADPQALTRDELRRLAKAERKVASADRVISVGGRREIQDLGRRHDERLESQSLAARLAETSSLALSRGEEVKSESVRIAVPLVDEHGARIVRKGLPVYRQETVSRVRILSRGGLQLAFDRGDLDGGPANGESAIAVATAKLLGETAQIAGAAQGAVQVAGPSPSTAAPSV